MKTIFITILIIVLALVFMFIVDAHQMRNNKPVIFSTWVLERIYCEKDGEIVKECGSSIPYLFIVDYDNDTNLYKVVDHFIPKDGNRYEDSLKELFIPSVRRQIEDFDMSNEIKKLIFKIEETKDGYYNIH